MENINTFARTAEGLGREEHWLKLEECFGRMLSDSESELCGAMVYGEAGTGKTFLVENYVKQFEDTHPVLIARHHHQHKEIPYFGFKYGISDYLGKIYKEFGREKFQGFSHELRDQLDDSFLLLLDYIPELSLLAGRNPVYSEATPKVENQLYPLFKTIFSFLADYYKRPVLFITEDLQWMDGPGINLLKYLLKNLSREKLIWLGACRIPQDRTNGVSQLIDTLSLEKKYIENIYLNGLTLPQARTFIEVFLGNACHASLVKVCFDLSGGNPSFLRVLLESLKNTNLIWLESNAWQCDKKSIRDRYKGQNTQIIFRERVSRLSPAAYDMLCITACMGRFSRRTLVDWLKGDAVRLEALIKEAEEAGLLEQPPNNIPRFSEMHIGEMIYNGLSQTRRVALHYMIAQLIYSRGFEQLNGTKIIFMTIHFNQSLSLVKKNGEMEMCAGLNYKAGYFSKQDNALDQANYFFKISADLLRECPWDKVFQQVFLVYMERARIEYNQGEYDLAEIHLDYLLERTHQTLKRAQAYQLKITINNHLGRYRKVVQILKESLQELGLKLPIEEEAVSREVKQLKTLLATQEKKTAARRTTTDNATQEAILKLLYVGGMGLHHTSDVLMTWAALQIIIRSEANTISGVKAIGCVSYARMLIISGDIEKGTGFGIKGLEINKSLGDLNLRCRVFGVYAFYVQPWKKAFADSNNLLEEGIRCGRKTGDLIGLYILKTHQLNLHFISGLPLKDLLHYDFEESYPGMELTYYITHYQKSLVKFLIGETAVFSIPRQQPSWLAARLTIQEEKFYRNYVWARYYFLFGYYALAERAAREANDNRKLQEGSPLVPANLVTWFLAITQHWPYYTNTVKEELETEIRKILSAIGYWRKYAPVNYECWWWLLNAEWLKIQGEERRALMCYKRSLHASEKNLYHRALTAELWAKYLLTLPKKKNTAAHYLKQAIHAFTEWGAVAKARQLVQQYQAILSDAYPEYPEMDVETIQRELSEDMEVASLIKKLMVLLLRVSGSTRVVVELVEDTGELSCYGDLSLFYDFSLSRTANRQAPENGGIPPAMVLLSQQSDNILLVNDLNQDSGMREIEALQQKGVKSFLVLPVTINGHLSMVIYLENSFRENWYQQERLKWVRITANQGAIIIENARTHEKAVKLNEDIRTEMKEKERLAILIEAQKDAHLRDLVQTQDNERKRIASDLHDSLGSLLSSVKLRFNGLQDEITRKVPDQQLPYSETLALLNDAIHEVRRIAHNMSPVSLKRFGLRAAIQTFMAQVNASEQLNAGLQVLGLEDRLPEQIEVAAYRICQELVQNVIRHAKATIMRLQIIGHKDALNIIVEDNGIGMDRAAIEQGFGFSTIQSKINLFKGSFTIESKPGQGTMVLVDIPVLPL